MGDFFNKSISNCLEELNSSFKGLSSTSAETILNSVGENILKEKDKKSIISIFIEQFKDLLVIILIFGISDFFTFSNF